MKAKDIDSLDDFKRRTKEVIVALKRSGRPRVLTVNGKAAVVVQDASAYFEERELAAAQEECDTLAAIKEGLAQLGRGEHRPAKEFFDELLGRKAKSLPRTAQKAGSRRKAS